VAHALAGAVSRLVSTSPDRRHGFSRPRRSRQGPSVSRVDASEICAEVSPPGDVPARDVPARERRSLVSTPPNLRRGFCPQRCSPQRLSAPHLYASSMLPETTARRRVEPLFHPAAPSIAVPWACADLFAAPAFGSGSARL
jgi:hypothetical protein